jgi:glycosyltransferase involved in cell wall biosynthesis
MRNGIEDEFNTGRNSQLVENAQQIFLDGVLAQSQFIGNLAIAEQVRHKRDDLFFAWRHQRLAAGIHHTQQIRLLPWISGEDLDELLSNAAVFVLPSDLEGMSLALLDAMAAGVCVLTSDIPENQEVVAGVGFTFKRGDRSDLTRVLDLLMRILTCAARWLRKASNRSSNNTSGPKSHVP